MLSSAAVIGLPNATLKELSPKLYVMNEVLLRLPLLPERYAENEVEVETGIPVSIKTNRCSSQCS